LYKVWCSALAVPVGLTILLSDILWVLLAGFSDFFGFLNFSFADRDFNEFLRKW
jgi:hypothetical protein